MPRATPLLVLALLAGTADSATAQAGQLAPQARQAILDYELTLPRAEHLITAMQEMTKYLVSLPDYQDRMRKSMTMTPAERVAQLEKDPKAAGESRLRQDESGPAQT